jgi:hypothetical protein
MEQHRLSQGILVGRLVLAKHRSMRENGASLMSNADGIFGIHTRK